MTWDKVFKLVTLLAGAILSLCQYFEHQEHKELQMQVQAMAEPVDDEEEDEAYFAFR